MTNYQLAESTKDGLTVWVLINLTTKEFYTFHSEKGARTKWLVLGGNK